MSFENYRWTCACCGKEMTGLPMDVGYASPSVWDRLDDATRSRSLLDSDFCWIDYGDGEADRFIRCLMTLPVIGTRHEFGFGVWMSVSEASWRIYDAGFEKGVYAEEGCFGYLSHEIADFPGSLLLHANVFFEPGNRRPTVMLKDTGHPLAHAQRHGIALSQVERWVAMSKGH